MPDVEAGDFRLDTVPALLAERGDPAAEIDARSFSLESLHELADRDEAEGLGDAPWPPHFRKQTGEPNRVQPSRAKKPAPAKKAGGAKKRSAAKKKG